MEPYKLTRKVQAQSIGIRLDDMRKKNFLVSYRLANGKDVRDGILVTANILLGRGGLGYSCRSRGRGNLN